MEDKLADNPNFKTAYVALGFFAIGILVFSPALVGEFIWDDWAYIISSTLLNQTDALRLIWFSNSAADPWPVTYTVFYALKHMFGENPLGYHVVSNALHCLNSFLAFLVLRKLNFRYSLLASLLFLIHPVNTEAVAWAFQIKTLLACTFLAFSALAWLHNKGLVLTLILFSLSLLTKPVYVAIPFLLLFRPKDFKLFLSGLVISVFVTLLNLTWYSPLDLASPIRSDGVLGKILGVGWAAWFYIYKTLFPIQLALIYERWSFPELTLTNGLPNLAFLVLLAAVFYFRNQLPRSVLFGFLFWLMALLPVLGFVDILFMRFSLVSDHWHYPALLGLLICLVPLLRKAGPVTFLILGALAARSFLHSMDFRYDKIFLQSIAQNPKGPIAHDLLGLEYLRYQKLDLALEQFDQSLDIRPDPRAYFNRGIIYDSRNDIENARLNYESADKLDPNYHKNLSNWGVTLLKIGRTQEAIEKFTRAVALAPDNATYQFNLQLAQKQLKGN